MTRRFLAAGLALIAVTSAACSAGTAGSKGPASAATHPAAPSVSPLVTISSSTTSLVTTSSAPVVPEAASVPLDTVSFADGGAAPAISSTGDNAVRAQIPEAILTCSHEQDGSWELLLVWEVQGATGLAVSVDTPGRTGSFGTFTGSAGDTILPPDACYLDTGPHEIDLATVGADNGQDATKVLHYTGTHTRAGSTTGSATTRTRTKATAESTR